ncbi:YchJ family protein [Trichlorobacter ammonificans]|uniref:NTF2-like domain-containing protein YchJ n=1 Tax=Trichlorobacter ammonificans TaxID=2916410 RepID=A0ABN8HL80_9BACT|nr:YchJ family protein [Trichlorobacter ammonificans]CAH2031937.1 putative NTF2-like domain-containing protein YchJ [Trichlorobacter ammonificans]
MSSCPCGSGSSYTDCCLPIIKNLRPAETAEALMRARYAAYATTEMDFVFESTHPDHRQNYDHDGTRAWAESSEWLGLQIVATDKGGPTDDVGQVEFIARFREQGGAARAHHENSRFLRQDGRWYFADGVMVKNQPIIVSKVGRNDPCTCGSGLKYKKCCGK